MATGIGAFPAVRLEPRVPSKPRAVFPSAALGVRQEWLPLFDRYGGDLVACGHTRQYETLIPAAAPRTTAPPPVLQHVTGPRSDVTVRRCTVSTTLSALAGYQANTTVRAPTRATRSSACRRNARASTTRSTSRPIATSSAAACSMMGPSSRSFVT